MTDYERFRFIMKDSKYILKNKKQKVPKIRATLSQLVTFLQRTKNPYYKYRLQNRFIDLYYYMEDLDPEEAERTLRYLGLK